MGAAKKKAEDLELLLDEFVRAGEAADRAAYEALPEREKKRRRDLLKAARKRMGRKRRGPKSAENVIGRFVAAEMRLERGDATALPEFRAAWLAWEKSQRQRLTAAQQFGGRPSTRDDCKLRAAFATFCRKVGGQTEQARRRFLAKLIRERGYSARHARRLLNAALAAK